MHYESRMHYRYIICKKQQKNIFLIKCAAALLVIRLVDVCVLWRGGGSVGVCSDCSGGQEAATVELTNWQSLVKEPRTGETQQPRDHAVPSASTVADSENRAISSWPPPPLSSPGRRTSIRSGNFLHRRLRSTRRRVCLDNRVPF